MRTKFSLGVVLTLLGVSIIAVAGIWKPAPFLPYAQWRHRVAPVNLAWLGGLALCAAGILLTLRELLSWRPAERESIELREHILAALSQKGMSQQQLNEIIATRYSKTGLLSLSTMELREVLEFVEAFDERQ